MVRFALMLPLLLPAAPMAASPAVDATATVAPTMIAPTMIAQQYDPGRLPSLSGRVAQYSLTPRGDVDGLILMDGTEVHLSPGFGRSLAAIVKPGDAVTVHGLRARALPMVQAVSITNDATGQRVVDDGGPPQPELPPAAPVPSQPMVAQGQIRQQLHGPRGDLNGVLLTDGTIVRMPPPEAQRLAARLQPGQTVTLRGDGIDGPYGRVVDAREMPR